MRTAEARRLVTPEGVPLGIRPADMGARVGAYIIDMLIVTGLLIAVSVPLIMLGIFVPGARSEWLVVAFLIGNFVVTNGYFILMEMGPKGATFGKRRAHLRVVSTNGSRLTADAIIARNLMRNLEFSLPMTILGGAAASNGLLVLLGLLWTGVFLAFPFFSKDHQRVGDLLAGTLVVEIPRRDLEAPPTAIDGGWSFTDAQLDTYGALELHKLDEVLEAEQYDVMERVADAIRTRNGIQRSGPPGPFLHAYRLALRERLQRDLLFGRMKERRAGSQYRG